MRDIKTFIKLFDLNVPHFEHFDYYIDQYSRLDKFKHLSESINLYKDFENLVENPYNYKLEKANQVIDFIKGTRAFNELNDDNLLPDLSTTKNFEYSEEKKYISIDINSANWFILKKYDPHFTNDLGNNWEDFLSKFDIHPVFYKSKQFRQFIFGHVNPKRQIKAQRAIIENLLNTLYFNNLEITCIKSDEIILSFQNWSDITELIDQVDEISYLKWKLYTVERVDNFRINNFYDKFGSFTHKELSGCNGNKYFMFLKKYILNESLDIRDLYFKIDGDLAIWNVEELEVKI
jgi:hypothetical protein